MLGQRGGGAKCLIMSKKQENVSMAVWKIFVSLLTNNHIMKVEEAIVYLLASSGRGMRTEQLAREINARGLCAGTYRGPVTDKQVYAVIMAHPDTFVKSEGRIRLMI